MLRDATASPIRYSVNAPSGFAFGNSVTLSDQRPVVHRAKVAALRLQREVEIVQRRGPMLDHDLVDPPLLAPTRRDSPTPAWRPGALPSRRTAVTRVLMVTVTPFSWKARM